MALSMAGEVTSEFMAKVEEWREAQGLSPREFAVLLGISEGYLSQLRSGKRRGSLRAEKLIDAVLRKRPEFEFYLTADLRRRSHERAA